MAATDTADLAVADKNGERRGLLRCVRRSREAGSVNDLYGVAVADSMRYSEGPRPVGRP